MLRHGSFDAPRLGGRGRCSSLLCSLLLGWRYHEVKGQLLDPTQNEVENEKIVAHIEGHNRALGVVLDANYRWLHNGAGTTCELGPFEDETQLNQCYLQGLDQATYEGTYGIYAGNANQKELTLRYASFGQYASSPNYGSRVFLTDGDNGGYYTFQLLGKEISFTIDIRNVPAGMNAAIYLVSMDRLGNLDASKKRATSGTAAGWQRGVGYCDAQCPKDVKFVQNLGYRAPNSTMSCCPEMDLFEGNRFAVSMTAHPCVQATQSACDASGDNNCSNPCDTDGADYNPFRRNGPTHAIFELLDPQLPIQVKTQFWTDPSGQLSSILQTYSQTAADGSERSFDMELNDDVVGDMKDTFQEHNEFYEIGGMAQMGRALGQGMVLTVAIWSDDSQNMNWLDSCTSDVEKTGYNCSEHSTFSADEFQRATQKAPGVWRGPADYYPDLEDSFGTKKVRFNYERLPKWMAEQSPFECQKVGLSFAPTYDCQSVKYSFTLRNLEVKSLHQDSGLPWYSWLFLALVCLACISCSAALMARWAFGVDDEYGRRRRPIPRGLNRFIKPDDSSSSSDSNSDA